jgi:hypothetical protein
MSGKRDLEQRIKSPHTATFVWRKTERHSRGEILLMAELVFWHQPKDIAQAD